MVSLSEEPVGRPVDGKQPYTVAVAYKGFRGENSTVQLNMMPYLAWF